MRLENIWEVALVMAWHHLLHLSKWVSQPWETETQALLSINRPLKGGKRRKVHKMTVRKKKSSNEIVVNFHIISRNSKYLFNFFVEVKHILESKKIIKIELCLMHICKYPINSNTMCVLYFFFLRKIANINRMRTLIECEYYYFFSRNRSLFGSIQEAIFDFELFSS